MLIRYKVRIFNDLSFLLLLQVILMIMTDVVKQYNEYLALKKYVL